MTVAALRLAEAKPPGGQAWDQRPESDHVPQPEHVREPPLWLLARRTALPLRPRQKAFLWRRARSRRDGYDLLACPLYTRDHPETGLTHTRKAVASLGRTCPARTRRCRAGSGRLGNAAGRRRRGDRGVYSVPVVSAKISSAIW